MAMPAEFFMSASSKSSQPSQQEHLVHWHVVDNELSLAIPQTISQWLLDSDSLTARIKRHCQQNKLGDFSVHVLLQEQAPVSEDEAVRLQLAMGEVALIREVLLYCGDLPVVFARTVIPLTSLSGSQQQLAHLGNKPLGEFLFSQPDLERNGMEVTALLAEHGLYHEVLSYLSADIALDTGQAQQQKPEKLWARRSVFCLSHKPLLVAEVFLPDLLACPT